MLLVRSSVVLFLLAERCSKILSPITSRIPWFCKLVSYHTENLTLGHVCKLVLLVRMRSVCLLHGITKPFIVSFVFISSSTIEIPLAWVSIYSVEFFTNYCIKVKKIKWFFIFVKVLCWKLVPLDGFLWLIWAKMIYVGGSQSHHLIFDLLITRVFIVDIFFYNHGIRVNFAHLD